jgi:hypothetical protein
MWSSTDNYPIDEVHTSPRTLQIGGWVIKAKTFLSTADPMKKTEAEKTPDGYIIKKGTLLIREGHAEKEGSYLSHNKRKGEYKITRNLTLVFS